MIEDIIVKVLIGLGAAIMVFNVIGYIIFLYRMKDVISSGRKSDNVWLVLGLVLLVFFLTGYIVVASVFDPALLTAFILFFGSLFVSIMLLITSRLLVTAKTRSLEIAQLLIDVVDERDPNLCGHSSHVKNIVMLFYRYLPFHIRASINPISLEYASLMHDIGKLGVPEAILNKPAKLTDEEWEIMKKHPKLGVKFLDKVETFNSVKDWILYHHEREDGYGYYGMDPMNVPLPAKIIAIADTYSAITMKRSYKDSKTHEEAIEIIKQVSGTQLDSELVDMFLNIPKEDLLNCMPDKLKE